LGPIVAAGILPLLGTIATADDRPTLLEFTVEAGRYDRRDTPVQIAIPIDEFPEDLGAFFRGDHAVARLLLREQGGGPPITAQVDPPSDGRGSVRFLWILPGETKAGSRRVLGLDLDSSPIEEGIEP